jgi:hypothetical protein
MDEGACTWRMAGEPGGRDAVGAALTRSHATLWYGSHCLSYSRTHDVAGNFLLRLRAVGDLLPAGIEAPILVLSDGGDAAEQLIAPEGEGEGTETVQRLGRALFAEVARALDLQAQWP